jgi:hypothetical protein
MEARWRSGVVGMVKRSRSWPAVKARRNGEETRRRRHLQKGGYQGEFWLDQFLVPCFFFLVARAAGRRKNTG